MPVTEKKPAMHATRNDMPERVRQSAAALCDARLADAIDVMLQAKHAHWNVRGPQFFQLHKLFDKVHEEMVEYVDTIAERAAQFGAEVHGTIRSAAQRSNIPEYPAGVVDGMKHVEALSTALANLGELVRKAIDDANELNDAGTADVFTEVSRGVDQLRWFVEAHTHM